MTEREIQDLLREMRDEPVPADSLTRVRVGVEERIGKKSWIAGWKIAAALVMAGCIVGAFLLLRPGKPESIERPVVAEIAQVLPPAESPLAVERPVVRVARAKRARPRPVVETVPVSIRIETPDPDVVILLVN